MHDPSLPHILIAACTTWFAPACMRRADQRASAGGSALNNQMSEILSVKAIGRKPAAPDA
jgi:hypothetical protein